MERRSHQTVWTRMVKISQTQTPVGSIQGGVPLSRVNANPDDDDDDDDDDDLQLILSTTATLGAEENSYCRGV